MKKLFWLMYLLLLFQVWIVACSRLAGDAPLTFEDGYVNQQILLTAPSYSNTFRTFDPINLQLRHNSIHEVVFRNQVIVVSPDLADLSRPHQLRLYVSGDMKTGQGIQAVAAFVDLTLSP